MTQTDPGIEPQDGSVITAFEDALREFTQELNRLHIEHGAPSYAIMASASVRPRLTKAGLNEMLSGRRFASLEALLEFVRVLTTLRRSDQESAAGSQADVAVADEWRSRWRDVKLLQRQAQPASKRLRATVRQILDDAVQEAEAVREDARAEAGRIRASAEADAVRMRAQAQKDADELLRRARERAQQVRRAPAGKGSQAGSSRSWRRQGEGLALRPALRPLAAAVAVATLATTVVLTGDSILGTPGDCRAKGVEQLIPRAGLQGLGAVQQAAFAVKPEAIIPWPPNSVRPVFGFPSGPAASSSPQASPTPSAGPTPSPTPTPSPSPTPTASPLQDKHDPCAPQALTR
ncbi:hypothetical protein ACFWBF_18285 [Streptomyces sp. NPDC060028]|uniref:hypothetical protein n=1 Tax=Streptomyces sp. NPDC060028 TaxID=3347041 RepID=UPI0036B1961A